MSVCSYCGGKYGEHTALCADLKSVFTPPSQEIQEAFLREYPSATVHDKHMFSVFERGWKLATARADAALAIIRAEDKHE